MKMSRSINDYKDAIDSVKISDSFYKRTEMLLNESSEMEVTESGSSKIRVVSRAIVAAAACLIAVFGIKTVIDNRLEAETAVVTETIVQETTVVTVPVTIPETASPVVDRPEAEQFVNDSGVMMDDMPEIPNSKDTSVIEEGGYEAAPLAEEITEEVTPTADNANEETATEEPVQTTVRFTATEREGYPEMAEPEGTENIPQLNETAVEAVSVKITPYFDLGAIRSGENPVSSSGIECSDIINTIATAVAFSPETENSSFASLFLIQLSEQSTGLPYYTIYITDSSTLVCTRHDIDNQKRFTYQLSDNDYEAILSKLYLLFGNEAELEYFIKSEANS